MSDLQERIGRRLRAAREKAGLSQEQAAVSLGSTRATLALWESGARKAPATAVHGLARLYRVSGDYLLTLSDDPAPHQERGAPGVVDLHQAATDRTVVDLAEEAAEDAEQTAPRADGEQRSSS